MWRRVRMGQCAAVAALAMAAAGAPPAGAQIVDDCRVSGGGRILAANGDQATFGGSVSSLRPPLATGHEVYLDHGPVQPLRFRSLTVTAVVCNLDARRAEIIGTGEVQTVFGQQPVEFRIAVFVPTSNVNLPDFYRITLSNGYDSGEQPVLQGNLVMHAP